MQSNIYVTEIPKEKERMGEEKDISLKFGERHQLTDPRISTKPKNDKCKGNQLRCVIFKLLKLKKEKEYLESSQRKTTYYIKRNNSMDN